MTALKKFFCFGSVSATLLICNLSCTSLLNSAVGPSGPVAVVVSNKSSYAITNTSFHPFGQVGWDTLSNDTIAVGSNRSISLPGSGIIIGFLRVTNTVNDSAFLNDRQFSSSRIDTVTVTDTTVLYTGD